MFIQLSHQWYKLGISYSSVMLNILDVTSHLLKSNAINYALQKDDDTVNKPLTRLKRGNGSNSLSDVKKKMEAGIQATLWHMRAQNVHCIRVVINCSGDEAFEEFVVDKTRWALKSQTIPKFLTVNLLYVFALNA